MYLEYGLWAYLIAWPVYVYFGHENDKQRIEQRPEKLISMYKLTMLQLWLPVLVLLCWVNQFGFSYSELGLKWHWNIQNQIALGALVVLLGYFFLSVKQVRENSDNHQELKQQFDYIRWLMPKSVKEYRYFTLGVSVSAGICEEIIYRGYLLHKLTEIVPVYAAVIISSLIFGMGHLYQGLAQTIRTALFGAVMALVYLATDSLVIPIILHIAIDIYSGTLGYCLFGKKANSNQI